MNKKSIWTIVGVMGLAVLGVVWLQTDLIRKSMKENEKTFNEKVYFALRKVAASLEKKEVDENLAPSVSGYSLERLKEVEAGDNLREVTKYLEEINAGATSDRDALLQNRLQKQGLYSYRNQKQPLSKRIDKEFLHTAINQELANAGINTKVEYGVFEEDKKSFVIVNGDYAFTDNQAGGNASSFQTLIKSDYSVYLYSEEKPAPGRLFVFFPNKTQALWRSLWVHFLGLVVLMGLILLCFAYTVNVIFRQKKIGEMKTDFINNMTHEFKTPIATISLATDSIISSRVIDNPEKVARFANIIKQENKRMNGQVERVLQMARLDKEDYKLELDRVNINDVIEMAVGNIRLQVEQREGSADAHLEATEPIIEGDLNHLQNIINNLLDNANKYSPEQPDIDVYTRNVANGVQIEIQDKGMGMSKEARKHIFDKFYRVHTGNRHDVKGFGLGLSYVKAMMDAHHGQIEVKSEVGKGSSFILTLPARQPAIQHH